MKKLALLSVVLVGAAMSAQAAFAGGFVHRGPFASKSAPAGSFADRNHFTPIYMTLPARGVDDRSIATSGSLGRTIPFFRTSVVSPLDGKTYNWEMVGTNPMTDPVKTTVKYVPIMVRVHFSDGTVLDPTQPGCNDTVSVQDRFFGSPIFMPTHRVSNGVDVGHKQLEDAFQRANFWQYAQGTPYGVELKQEAAPVLVDVTAPSGSKTAGGVCTGTAHNIGEINISSWDNIVEQLDAMYAKPNELPIVLSYNVFETSGGQCCIIGYHSAFQRKKGVQTYAVGAYNDAGIFSVAIEDIDAWSHELGEWMDDPFVQGDGYNFTPAWGHTGQTSGCQDNLEVGDPLTGTTYTIKLNGFTYHPQELAFYSWFYRVASTGTGGLFSLNGTFTSAQGACS